ncbi:MAG: HDOD domain-containing protein [Leptospiraceae bacterium]|nr:HDOD domain-containing protein [Leptospiraceae bacterium]
MPIENKKIDLPPMPQVVAKIIQIDENKLNVSSDQIQALIAVDPALTSKILKIANSAFYARATPVTSLSQAITLLGFKTIKSLTLLVSASSMFPKSRKSIQVQKEIWMRSVLAALVGKIIAEMSERKAVKDEVFMIALLRNIGQLILNQSYPDEYLKIYEGTVWGIDYENLRILEKEAFGFTSAEMSIYAMETWNFTESFKRSASIPDLMNIPDDPEFPQVLPGILGEIVVIWQKLTEHNPLSEEQRGLFEQLFDVYASQLKISEKDRAYLSENLRDNIKDDSFYSFCEELFSM